jgi:acetyltransferase-like isoleucine patch superfamily enzyme
LPIEIGAEAWLATDVYVAPGVSIGRGTIVGARSSVFSNMPDGMICRGSPARAIKRRDSATPGNAAVERAASGARRPRDDRQPLSNASDVNDG